MACLLLFKDRVSTVLAGNERHGDSNIPCQVSWPALCDLVNVDKET